MLQKRNLTILILIIFLGFGSLLVERCTPKENNSNISTVQATNEFVGVEKCASCHRQEYNAWLTSDHFKAMQPANDSTVEGDFSNKTLTADGVTSKFFKKDGKYYINTQGDDGKNHDYEIKYTFGYYPLQQYLVEFPGGRMQVTRASWDVKDKKWYHQYAGQKIPPHDWLHWTGNAQNWNTMCATCHSTDLQKNYSPQTDTYNTTYKVINVSCESCHGPGKMHIDYINSNDYKNGKLVAGSYMELTKQTNQTGLINKCAPCHARTVTISANPILSNEILDNYIPEVPTNEHYYADGQANDEDYVYTSFLESKMYRRGVTCTNCHNPHTGKTILTTNALCLQCHAKTYDDPSHTFHTMGTIAADCKSCHMPGKIYMGIDYRYDHTFRVPRPDLSVKYGTPNACNNCHKDKTFQWAVNAVEKWYGPKRQYYFSDDLIPGSKLDANSFAHLSHLIADTATPAIVKGAAAYYLGQIQDNNSLNLLLNCLQNPAAQVRYRALRSLTNFAPESWMDAAGPLLSDSVRAVRIAAADLFVMIPANQIPQNLFTPFSKAKSELLAYNMYQTDFSVGDMMMGDYYLKTQDYYSAEKFYLLGLKKDTSMNYARLNLSVVYNLTNRNDKALQVLQDALKVDPKNERTYFNLGLLYNEMNNKAGAEQAFAKAAELKSQNPRVYYNYGLMLEQDGKKTEAENMFKKGLQLSPLDDELNYALALLYVQSGRDDKARGPAAILKQYYSSNPDYQKILQHLGM